MDGRLFEPVPQAVEVKRERHDNYAYQQRGVAKQPQNGHCSRPRHPYRRRTHVAGRRKRGSWGWFFDLSQWIFYHLVFSSFSLCDFRAKFWLAKLPSEKFTNSCRLANRENIPLEIIRSQFTMRLTIDESNPGIPLSGEQAQNLAGAAGRVAAEVWSAGLDGLTVDGAGHQRAEYEGSQEGSQDQSPTRLPRLPSHGASHGKRRPPPSYRASAAFDHRYMRAGSARTGTSGTYACMTCCMTSTMRVAASCARENGTSAMTSSWTKKGRRHPKSGERPDGHPGVPGGSKVYRGLIGMRGSS